MQEQSKYERIVEKTSQIIDLIWLQRMNFCNKKPWGNACKADKNHKNLLNLKCFLLYMANLISTVENGWGKRQLLTGSQAAEERDTSLV